MRTTSSTGSVDRLIGLLHRFEVQVTLIDGVDPLRRPQDYGTGGREPCGHLHVLGRGAVDLRPIGGSDVPARRLEGPALVLIPGAAPHRIVPVDGPALTCAALRFAHGEGHPLVRALPRVLDVPTGEVPGLGSSLGLLAAEVDHVRCGAPLVASRLLEVILLQLLRWVFDHPQEAGISRGLVQGMADPGIAGALTAVHEEPGAAWSLDELARTATMSRSAFAARFRELVGETPAAYVAGYRVALAKQGLLRGQQVASLAAELGYANGSGLSRAFTAHTGQSPSAWLAATRSRSPA
ncbi:MAG: AraC family transcriptional regulator [Patulibacter minatonensis]